MGMKFPRQCVGIAMSLCGSEIPTKWHWNEIPTNRPSELYIIYNPAYGAVIGYHSFGNPAEMFEPL